MTDCSKQCAKT